MNIRDLFKAAWRQRLVAVVVLLLITGSVAGFTVTREDVYEAKATVALLPANDDPVSLPLYGTVMESLLPAYYPLMDSRSFMDRVARDVPFATGGEILRAVHVQPTRSRNVLQIVAQWPTPEGAARIAERTTASFVRAFEPTDVARLEIIDPPRIPESPVGPGVGAVIAATALVGLVFGAAAAAVWDLFFGRVRDSVTLTAVTGLPVLGTIPRSSLLKNKRMLPDGFNGDEQGALISEAFRNLRTNVLFQLERQGGPLVVTSLREGEGKSTVSVNLALQTAALGYDTLLVDADVHRPVIHDVFKLANDHGLTSMASWTAPQPEDLVSETAHQHLRVVTSGPLQQDEQRDVAVQFSKINRFADVGEIVVVDSPPLRAGDEVRLLAANTSATLLTVRAGACSKRELVAAVNGLRQLGVWVVGAVLTHAKERPAAGAPLPYYAAMPAAQHTPPQQSGVQH
jgi:polysaccharide biosynthesis transport protein